MNSNEVIKLIKTCLHTDIPTNIIKVNVDLLASYIFRNFNYSVEKGKFPCVFKDVDVVPVHKKKEKNDKANYRTVCTLFFYKNQEN